MSTAAFEFVMLFAGLAGVVVCAKIFLNGAVGVAQRFGIPEFIVGSIIVAIGTSAPELAINLAASLQHAGDVIASNIIGSNIVNIGLGIGLAGLFVKFKCAPKSYIWAIVIGLLGTILMLMIALFSGQDANLALFSRPIAALLFAGFLAFTYWTLKNPDCAEDDDEELPEASTSLVLIAICLLAGAIGMSYFANLTVSNAVAVATSLGIPDAVIGATIIAAGGSLPEVISCIEAARMKRANIVIGNIVGSQIFNIFGILGVSGLVAPFMFSRGISIDVTFLLAMTIIWLASFYIATLRRFIAPILIGTYGLYALYLIKLAAHS